MIYSKSHERGKSQPRILYPARLSFRIVGETKNSSDNQNLKEILKGLLQIEKKQESIGKGKTKQERQIYKRTEYNLNKSVHSLKNNQKFCKSDYN